MDAIIRQREYKDIDSIAKVIVLGWQQNYRGIVNDAYLDAMDENSIAEMQKKNMIQMMIVTLFWKLIM